MTPGTSVMLTHTHTHNCKSQNRQRSMVVKLKSSQNHLKQVKVYVKEMSLTRDAYSTDMQSDKVINQTAQQ